MEVILKGLGFGLILSLTTGPVFFALLQTSVDRGFTAGLFMAMGISISDISFVVISYLGFSKLISLPKYELLFSLVGGIILLLLGIYTFFKRKSSSSRQFVKNPKNIVRALAKGFIMNTFSPFVLIYWLGVMGFATVDLGFADFELRLFFATILITVLSADVTKAWLANKLRALVRPRVINTVNIITGVVLVGFGARLLYLAATI